MNSLLKSRTFLGLIKKSNRNFCSNNNKKSEERENTQDDDYEKNIWEEDEEMDESEDEGPSILKKILKYSFFGGLTYLFYKNCQYVNESGADPLLASNNTFYVKPIYSSSAYIMEKCQEGYNYLRYPPMKKFLPDEPPINKQMLRKTLVLNFEGTMYSKDFKAGEGLVLHLRPGFRKFIKEMSPKYEIVVYTQEDTNFINEVIQTIDPFQTYLHWYFGNEFLTTKTKGLAKDLSFLNRTMDRVVVVDFKTDVYANNKENIIFMKHYNGEKKDDSLKELTFFLNHLAEPKVKDVRREIKKYGGFHSAENFKNQLDEKFEKMKNKRKFFSKNLYKV